MGTVNGTRYAKELSAPHVMNPIEFWGGNVHYKMDEYEAASLAANEVIQFFSMNIGDVVVDAALSTDDLGSPVTIDVGDGGDVDRFIDGHDGNTVGISRMTITGGAIASIGYQYTAADTLDAKILGATANGTINLGIMYVPRGG
ncbi:hypothetical protein CMI37_31370 [Candidatus Pacearchaeota archaeon]|nr:hypothetical protein [Candidatus Pacearchaeota archaeon]|tara:strand:+ start:1406 stop:1837 length:432 start_codon:yes stop_codon:yes gene_type:complete